MLVHDGVHTSLQKIKVIQIKMNLEIFPNPQMRTVSDRLHSIHLLFSGTRKRDGIGQFVLSEQK